MQTHLYINFIKEIFYVYVDKKYVKKADVTFAFLEKRVPENVKIFLPLIILTAKSQL
jgi:hypothetical protein